MCEHVTEQVKRARCNFLRELYTVVLFLVIGCKTAVLILKMTSNFQIAVTTLGSLKNGSKLSKSGLDDVVQSIVI